jgi:hypothetical protein
MDFERGREKFIFRALAIVSSRGKVWQHQVECGQVIGQKWCFPKLNAVFKNSL